MAKTGFQVGALIENRYRVFSVIGSGGMGILYRIPDEARDGEMVALKTVRLKRPDIEGPESGELFQREFQILTRLRHPNLVSVYDYGIMTEGELYFTMEWVQGQNLEFRLRQLDPTAVIPIIIQICRALAYLHARGVIHGNLKPRNVLMAGDRAKIVGFGVARETRAPEVGERFYTPGYAAPEVRRQQLIDHRKASGMVGQLWRIR